MRKIIKCLFWPLCVTLIQGCGVTDTITANLPTGSLSPVGAKGFSQLGQAKQVSNVALAASPSIQGSQPAEGLRIVRDASAEQYLRGILDRLLKHWHGEQPTRIGVFITANPRLAGSALPSGDILISTGAFEKLKSEDEMAALLAHEAAHVLLKHHEDERNTKQLAKVANVVATGAIGWSLIRNSSTRKLSGGGKQVYWKDPNAIGQDALNSVIARESVRALTEDVFLHAYSRSQETEADRFAVELTRMAGYDHTAIKNLLQHLHSAEVAHANTHKSEKRFTSISGALVGGLGEMLAPIVRTHPKAETRLADVSNHMLNRFGDVTPPRPTVQPFNKVKTSGRFGKILTIQRLLNEANEQIAHNNPASATKLTRKALRFREAKSPDVRLVSYEIFLNAGQTQLAFDTLRGASKTEKGSLSFYVTLADEYRERGRTREMQDVYTRAGKQLVNPTLIYPAEIASYRLTQNVQALQTSYQTCMTTANDTVKKACDAAFHGRSLDDEFRNSGGLISNIVNNGQKALDPTSLVGNSAGNAFSTMTQTFGGLFGN